LDHFSRGDGSEEREEPVHTWSTRPGRRAGGAHRYSLFYPGVRFAHPRLSSFRPAGAEFGTTEAVAARSEAMNVNLTDLWTLCPPSGPRSSSRRWPPVLPCKAQQGW